jgi:NADH-quinone oxidoreductase subunit M
MILVAILGILVAGGLLAWAADRIGPSWARGTALAAVGADLVLVAATWVHYYDGVNAAGGPSKLIEWHSEWIPRFGIGFHLSLDGLSLVLVALTVFLGFIAIVSSATEVKTRVGFFHFNLLLVLAGIAGVFLAADLFLFYFFWEMMLVPMYFLIGIWGHEKRVAAAFKFFLFTQAGGLAMLLAILGLYFIHGRATGTYTFDAAALIGTPLGTAGPWIMAGFLLAFLVKTPGLPFHTWLPDAHAQAPTAGSVILAGLLLKTGAYGLIRFVLPLDPEAIRAFAPFGLAIGAAGVLYGAKLAFAQSDLKRMVAYTSVSHMGFVLIGVFALNAMALQGAILQIVCHGVSTGALFIAAGAIQERLRTRDLGAMGGYWSEAPRLGAATLVFALASLGLPGLGNFAAEFIILFGAFRTAPVVTAVASLGLIAATIYALSLFRRIFQGPRAPGPALGDIGLREVAVFAALALVIIWLGLYPQPVLDTSRAAATGIEDTIRKVKPASPVLTNAPGKTPAIAPVSRDPGPSAKGDAP